MLGDLNEWSLGVGEFLDDLFSLINEVIDVAEVLGLFSENVGLISSSGGDEFQLFLHDLLVGSSSDEISVGGSEWGLASSSMLSGSSQGVNSVGDFLLSETKFVIAFSLLDLVDAVVLSLFVSDGKD